MPKPRINPLIQDLGLPPVPLVKNWIAEYDGSAGPVLDFSQAVPGYDAHPKLLASLAHYAGQQNYTDYGPIEGDENFRIAYAMHLSGVYGAEFGKENTLISSGCNQAFVMAAMTVAGPGDHLLLTSPFYFNHETSLAMMGIGVETFDLKLEDRFQPDLLVLEAAITPKTKAVAFVSPNNPTGAIYSNETLQAIFELCRARGIWLILDETYRDFLPLEMSKPHSLFDNPDWADHLIQLYSFSKSFRIPGHRLGAIAASPEVIQNTAKIIDNIQICAPRAAQAAVADNFETLAAWREENRRKIANRSEAMQSALATVPGWKISSIGAYFSYVKHPFTGINSQEASEALARIQGVITIPGAFFGRDQEEHLRIAFANADIEAINSLPERLTGLSI